MKRKNEQQKHEFPGKLFVIIFALTGWILLLFNTFALNLVQNLFNQDYEAGILFSQLDELDYEIMLINPDTGEVQQLTHNDWDDWGASWSPDHRQIAYRSTNQAGLSRIYVMNADGTNPRAVTPIDMFVGEASRSSTISWSPDGRQLLIGASIDNNWDIYILDIETGSMNRIIDDPAHDYAPDWSPDGTRFVFTSHRNNVVDIYVANIDGTGVTRLSHSDWDMAYPRWSPDGTQIVFQGIRDAASDIFIMNADGTGFRQLTVHKAIDRVPAFSPDGSEVVFRSERYGDSEIVVMNLVTGTIRQITDDDRQDMSPDW